MKFAFVKQSTLILDSEHQLYKRPQDELKQTTLFPWEVRSGPETATREDEARSLIWETVWVPRICDFIQVHVQRTLGFSS